MYDCEIIFSYSALKQITHISSPSKQDIKEGLQHVY